MAPGRDTHRLGEIFGVAPVLGLYQEGPEIVLAVGPRDSLRPEQRSEEGMELPKGLVTPARKAAASTSLPHLPKLPSTVRSHYHTNCRCNT